MTEIIADILILQEYKPSMDTKFIENAYKQMFLPSISFCLLECKKIMFMPNISDWLLSS